MVLVIPLKVLEDLRSLPESSLSARHLHVHVCRWSIVFLSF